MKLRIHSVRYISGSTSHSLNFWYISGKNFSKSDENLLICLYIPMNSCEYTSLISYISIKPVQSQKVTLSSQCNTSAAAMKFIPCVYPLHGSYATRFLRILISLFLIVLLSKTSIFWNVLFRSFLIWISVSSLTISVFEEILDNAV